MYLYSSLFAQIIKLNTFFIATLQSVNTIYNNIARILAKVRNFNNFTKDNDPYGEHDFGSFDYNGEKIYWKIDYYDKSYCYLSENPANLDITNRVLTVMLADEY